MVRVQTVAGAVVVPRRGLEREGQLLHEAVGEAQPGYELETVTVDAQHVLDQPVDHRAPQVDELDLG